MRKILDKVNRFLSAATLFAMLILVVWQVFTRYILKNPSTWSEELVGFLFAWSTLFGASLIVSERGHMNIPAFVETKSIRFQKHIAIFSEIMVFSFSLFVLTYGGIRITKLALNQMTSSIGVAVGLFYVALPLTGFINMIYSLMNIFDIGKGKLSFAQIDSDSESAERVASKLAKFDKENNLENVSEENNILKAKTFNNKEIESYENLAFRSNLHKGE